MAWHYPIGMDLWPDATDSEARDWWEKERQRHNAFAERFNRDRMNTHDFYFFKKKMPRQIALMPGYDYMIKQFKKG